MNFQKMSAYIGLVLGSCLLTAQTPTQAFTFKTNYDAALTGSDKAKGDILLQSVELEDGTVLEDFTLVTGARIKYNDEYVGSNSGAASADIGDQATTGIRVEDAAPEDIVAVLNNKNLNNIIDTEENGTAEIDLFFENAVDNIFLWERGKNSQLDIQAIDAEGNAIGQLVQLGSSAEWANAGYRIDTQEISGSQSVGAIGINISEFDVMGPIVGVRVSSYGKSYNGPDWKLMGSIADIPEPSAVLGLLAAGGAMLKARRRHTTQD